MSMYPISTGKVPKLQYKVSEAAMAAVPEPTDEMAYYSSSENDLFFEAHGPRQMKHRFQDLDLISQEDDGIQLQISRQVYNRKFRQVVSVIVTVEKLRNMLVPDSLAFQDDDLRSLFSFVFEEEPIICDNWDDNSFVSDAPPRCLNCRLQDIEQKSLVLTEACQLHALHLRGESLNRQVVFCMSYVQGEETEDKIPVALGLKDKNMYLSCVVKDGKPTLQLERVDPKNYPKKRMEERFIFNKTAIKEHFEFESAQFPNWYISTSQAEELPVFLGNTRGNQDITDFSMEVITP
ncbi:Interleukin-1 beta [Galemys pyrenaicus]|uniref:Multifunctional fusion protein n=1 Tax=Galemys pyrenaicus TaxID=202257 RepID=A0A8J6AE44_GALPY|nr:Interleukin-1 beta [Galemys pyrenaicus]